jgi:hypothetical protein
LKEWDEKDRSWIVLVFVLVPAAAFLRAGFGDENENEDQLGNEGRLKPGHQTRLSEIRLMDLFAPVQPASRPLPLANPFRHFPSGSSSAICARAWGLEARVSGMILNAGSNEWCFFGKKGEGVRVAVI